MANYSQNGKIKNPVNAKITDGQTTKIVHINRLQHRKQPQHDTVPSDNTNTYTSWTPPKLIIIFFLNLLQSDDIHKRPDDHLIGFAYKAWGQAFKRRGRV